MTTVDSLLIASSPIKTMVQTTILAPGKEFAQHEKLAKEHEADIYLAYPYAGRKDGMKIQMD